MGYQSNGFALVSMTNKDVYYVSIPKGKEILRLMTRDNDRSVFVEVTDIKSGANIAIAVQHVSSVVVKEGSRDV